MNILDFCFAKFNPDLQYMKVTIHFISTFTDHTCSNDIRHSPYVLLLYFIIAVVSHAYNRTSNNKQVFHYNEQTGIATLDPAFAKNQSIMWAVHQLYNTLVETDPASEYRSFARKKLGCICRQANLYFSFADGCFFSR